MEKRNYRQCSQNITKLNGVGFSCLIFIGDHLYNFEKQKK